MLVGVLAALAHLVEEPDAFLGLVQQLLEQVAGRVVALLVAEFHGRAHRRGDVAVFWGLAVRHPPRRPRNRGGFPRRPAFGAWGGSPRGDQKRKNPPRRPRRRPPPPHP